MLIGYARVSTNEQDTQLQFDALGRAGVKRIFAEKTSSVGKRPELQKALASMKPGSLLVVYKLDRLARSLIDLLSIIQRLETIPASFKSLTEPIDTGTPAGRMMLQMLGAFAEFERAIIRQRSMAGQASARDLGKHCGRPRSIDPETEAEIVRYYRTGFYTLTSLATFFDLHPSTIKRAVYRVTKPGHSSLK